MNTKLADTFSAILEEYGYTNALIITGDKDDHYDITAINIGKEATIVLLEEILEKLQDMEPEEV